MVQWESMFPVVPLKTEPIPGIPLHILKAFDCLDLFELTKRFIDPGECSIPNNDLIAAPERRKKIVQSPVQKYMAICCFCEPGQVSYRPLETTFQFVFRNIMSSKGNTIPHSLNGDFWGGKANEKKMSLKTGFSGHFPEFFVFVGTENGFDQKTRLGFNVFLNRPFHLSCRKQVRSRDRKMWIERSFYQGDLVRIKQMTCIKPLDHIPKKTWTFA